MNSPFDGKIGAWFWQASSISEKSIDKFLDMLEAKTPNVRAVFVKSNNGKVWQGQNDTIPSEMNINGPADIARWVAKCTPRGFDVHCWCVVKGKEVEEEIDTITSACLVPGIRSMIFDLEVGDIYFVGGRQGARRIASEVRRRVADDFHMSVCLDGRTTHPRDVFVDEWIPFINSLQPMVYYDSFFPGKDDYDDLAESSLDAIMKNLERFDRPIYPIFPARPAVKDTMIDIAKIAIDRYNVRSYSLWRLGPTLYGKVLDEIKKLPVPTASTVIETVYTNQQIIDAVSKAAVFAHSDSQDWLLRADLLHLMDNRGGTYLGLPVMSLPGLADDQKQLILLALLDKPFPTPPVPVTGAGDVSSDTADVTPPEQTATNQKVINAFVSAAKALGNDDDVWKWFSSAKLNSILARDGRNDPYTGPAIQDLPKLTPEVKAKILFFLSLDQNRPVVAGTGTTATGTALRGANIDFGNPIFSPPDLKPFTCCRLVYKMSMESGNTDFDKSEQVYNAKINGYIAAKVTPVVVVNHQFYGEGKGFDWKAMQDDSDIGVFNRWKELTAQFQPHLRKLVQTYKDQIVYEIWNETDNHSDASVFIPEKSFAFMLDECIETIHSVSPNAKVIVGGLVSGHASYWHNTRAHMEHEDKLAGIGVHPYGREDATGSLKGLLDSYANGSPAVFWITEWGVLGDASKSEPPPSNPKDVENYAKRFLTAAQNDPRVAATIWYGYADGMHNGYGLAKSDGTRKEPLWTVFNKGL